MGCKVAENSRYLHNPSSRRWINRTSLDLISCEECWLVTIGNDAWGSMVYPLVNKWWGRGGIRQKPSTGRCERDWSPITWLLNNNESMIKTSQRQMLYRAICDPSGESCSLPYSLENLCTPAPRLHKAPQPCATRWLRNIYEIYPTNVTRSTVTRCSRGHS